MNRVIAYCALAATALAAEQDGLKPRADAAAYPAHEENQSVALGAALLSPEQVRGAFSTDLNRNYLVLEIGLYPKAGGKIDVGPGDFSLRVAGTQALSRPASPRTIAAVLQKSSGKRDVTLYPQVGVGYESGPYGHGTDTAVGVGVGVGENRPASTPEDRKTMALELGDKQLPEKMTVKPLAGYLYFPLPTKKKGVAYELLYEGPAGTLVAPLPMPDAKAR